MSDTKGNRPIKQTKIIMIVAVLIVVAAIAAFCVLSKTDAKEGTMANISANSDSGKFVVNSEGLMIHTQFISMLYPIDYANDVLMDLVEETGKTVLNVSTSIEGDNRELFSVILSTTEGEGHKLGILKQNSEEIGVYIKMIEGNMEYLPEQEVYRLSRLQESVNILLDQIYSSESFVSS